MWEVRAAAGRIPEIDWLGKSLEYGVYAAGHLAIAVGDIGWLEQSDNRAR